MNSQMRMLRHKSDFKMKPLVKTRNLLLFKRQQKKQILKASCQAKNHQTRKSSYFEAMSNLLIKIGLPERNLCD